MTRTPGRTALAGLAALALAVSPFGPCLCFLNGGACHTAVPEANAHACCEKPAGVQAVADACCDDSPELVLASTEIPEVAPPTLLEGHVRETPLVGSSTPVTAVPVRPPPSLDRTTVLLI
jgi:hypothetical protein